MFTFLTETMLTKLRAFTVLQGLMHLDDGGECARDILIMRQGKSQRKECPHALDRVN